MFANIFLVPYDIVPSAEFVAASIEMSCLVISGSDMKTRTGVGDRFVFTFTEGDCSI